MDATKIVVSPLVSEKNAELLAKDGIYVFEVALSADKLKVRAAVESLFSVDVVSVRTLVCRGRRSVRSRSLRVDRWKKALVKIAPGQKIGIFEGV